MSARKVKTIFGGFRTKINKIGTFFRMCILHSVSVLFSCRRWYSVICHRHIHGGICCPHAHHPPYCHLCQVSALLRRWRHDVPSRNEATSEAYITEPGRKVAGFDAVSTAQETTVGKSAKEYEYHGTVCCSV